MHTLAMGVVALVGLLSGPVDSLPTELAPQIELAVVQVEQDVTCPALDFTPIEVEAEEESTLEAAAAAPCKRCKDRPACTCSYQGKPRISCNPCCWQGAFDPYPICLD